MTPHNSNLQTEQTGIIILNHGSKAPEALSEFMELMTLLRAEIPNIPLQPACMGFSNPTLDEAVFELIHTKHCTHIKIFPCFLFKGNHIKEDIPNLVNALQQRYPDVRFELLSHIGPNPKLVSLIKERIL